VRGTENFARENYDSDCSDCGISRIAELSGTIGCPAGRLSVLLARSSKCKELAMNRSKLVPVAVAVVVAALLAVCAAQQVGEIKRNVLTKQDLSSVPGHEGVVAQVEFAPGAREARHTHPGEVLGYVEEGSIVLNVEGKPATTLKPGESFFIPAGAVHWGENTGNTPCKVLATFVVEKGKPLTSPAK
jgi:quercetin dioxygenase-like cupin family protein